MKKDKIYLILGALVLILPLSGFSRDSKNLLIYVCGILIVFLSLTSIYLNSKYSRKNKSDVFVESKPSTSFSEEKNVLSKPNPLTTENENQN
ncbi:MAG: hypothetical protein WCF92_03675 [bacterium]